MLFTRPDAMRRTKFICCSATMSSAPSHFASLLPLEECLGGCERLYYGSTDTAPTGRKTFVLWQPPIVAEWFTVPPPPRPAAKKKHGTGWGVGWGGRNGHRSRRRGRRDEKGNRWRAVSAGRQRGWVAQSGWWGR